MYGSFVDPRTDSGLVLSYSGQDEVTVRRALKDYDSELLLLPPGINVHGEKVEQRQGYRVYRYAGSARPPEFICFWGNDQGDPFPLSSGLLEKVKELDRNTRVKALDADVANALKKERDRRQAEADNQDVIDDWKHREGRSAILPRSQSLRQARARTGYHDA